MTNTRANINIFNQVLLLECVLVSKFNKCECLCRERKEDCKVDRQITNKHTDKKTKKQTHQAQHTVADINIFAQHRVGRDG